MVYHPYSLTQGREYYGPSLTGADPEQERWTERTPSPFYEQQSNLSGALMIGAGVVGTGFLPFRGKRLWDFYVAGLRGIEEYSPGGVLRTFQASTFFSQFTSQARAGWKIEAEFLRSAEGKGLREYLTTLIGEKGGTYMRLGTEGVQLKGGRLLFAETGDVALKYAGGMISPVAERVALETESYWGSIAGKHLGSGYARSMGAYTASSAYLPAGDARLFGQVFQTAEGQFHRQVIGARTLPGYIGRQLGGLGTEAVSRFNRLLQAPFEMQPFRSVFGTVQKGLKKLTGREIQFAVKEGSGLQMLGRLSAKYGLGLGAVALGYQTLDYMVRNAELFDDTAFEEGVTAGIATVGVKTNLAISKAAEATGLHTYREMQEELAPGSTSLGTLLGFPLLGALGAASSVYLARIAKTARLQREGLGVAAAAARAKDELKTFGGALGRLGEQISKTEGLYSRQDWVGKVFRKLGTADETGEVAYKFVGKVGPAKLAGLLGAGIGAMLVAPFLPGALIPSERPDELEAIYSGRKEVAIRKGRWWEFGRSPYEGQRIEYYRPHWYPRMMMGAREKGLYGEKERSPLENYIRKEFTYDWELEHYYDRPYPITSLPFEDVPFIGPLLAGTIGRLIKPPKLMHTEEWMRGEGVKAMPPAFGERVATDIGEQPPPKPISPYSAEGIAGEQVYRMTEMIGLPGFALTSVKEALTGTPDLFDQFTQLESARRAFGAERAYWDLEIGGGMGTTEALRRLFPHRRRQVPLYNPIRNLMPEWLPGPGEKSPDFRHGDPYTKVKEGELRLPGTGYEARFPELKGVRPEDYPLIHRYKILADVAPYTDKYKQTLQAVRAARKLQDWTDYEENIFQTTQEQVANRKIRKEFEEYEYLSPMGELTSERNYYGGEESSSLIAAINKMKAGEEVEPGVVRKLFGGYWELLAHNAETAIDQLTPVSPGAKLVHTRTAIEDYQRTQVFGTENAFWQHPWRDFLRPFTQLTASAFGFDSMPGHIKDRRALEEHFDILKYVKNARLSHLARMAGDTDAVKQFEQKKDETLFGLNPFTFNYRSIFRALPRRERDYFNSFAEAETVEERANILKLVPDNEKGLYVARWKMQFAEEVKKAKKAGILSEQDAEAADEIIEQTYAEAKTEGYPTSKELFAEYVETRLQGESYADWYRRTRLLADVPLPGADWVGWHPSVDLDDIKLKVVQNMGEDMHEYDLWPSRAQGLMNKPYINNEAVQAIMEPEELDSIEMQSRVEQLFNTPGVSASVFTRDTLSGDNDINMDIEQDVDIEGALAKVV